MKNDNHRIGAIPISELSRKKPDKDLPLAKPTWRWWTYAKCKDVPVEDRDRIFFPVEHRQELKEAYAEAHEFCRKCPVKNQCKESAIYEEGRRVYGYRGDMDHVARKQLFYDRKHKGLIKNERRPDDGLILRNLANRQKRESNE